MCAKKTAPEAPQTSIYIGPTLHRRRMVSYSVFRGPLPDYVNRLMEEIPDIRQMIILIWDMPRVVTQVKEPGTELHRIYQILAAVRFKEAE